MAGLRVAVPSESGEDVKGKMQVDEEEEESGAEEDGEAKPVQGKKSSGFGVREDVMAGNKHECPCEARSLPFWLPGS